MENSFGLGDVGVEVAQETTRNGVLVKCGPLLQCVGQNAALVPELGYMVPTVWSDPGWVNHGAAPWDVGREVSKYTRGILLREPQICRKYS